MAGIFDLKKGAFDSSEAGALNEAYTIAVQGLRASHHVDDAVVSRLARSILQVARGEPDCLRNDGTLDPIRVAHRAVLRMFQLAASKTESAGAVPMPRDKAKDRGHAEARSKGAQDTPAQVMMRLFERTPFAKL